MTFAQRWATGALITAALIALGTAALKAGSQLAGALLVFVGGVICGINVCMSMHGPDDDHDGY